MSLTDLNPIKWLGPFGGVLVMCVVLGGVFLVGSLAFQTCNGPHELSPAVRDSIAALAASKHADSVAHAAAVARADSAAASSARSGAASDRLDTVSRESEQHGISFRRAGDSLATLARAAKTAQDSAAHFRDAWRAERAHGDTLQVALDTARASRDSMRVSRDSARASALSWQRADSVSTARLVRVEKLNADLQRDAERLSSGCHVLPFVPCPSRTVVAVLGIVSTATTAYVVHTRDHARTTSSP